MKLNEINMTYFKSNTMCIAYGLVWKYRIFFLYYTTYSVISLNDARCEYWWLVFLLNTAECKKKKKLKTKTLQNGLSYAYYAVVRTLGNEPAGVISAVRCLLFLDRVHNVYRKIRIVFSNKSVYISRAKWRLNPYYCQGRLGRFYQKHTHSTTRV